MKPLTKDEWWLIENTFDDDQRYEFFERCGIIEYDGKLPRELAERKSFDAVISDAFRD